jgi:hypothetical protein
MDTYKILRFYQNAPTEIIKTGRTLDEAKKHCGDDNTKGEDPIKGKWFDGYEKENN